MEDSKKIGEELYWRFAKFEGLLVDNLLQVLYTVSPEFLNLIHAGVASDCYEYELSEYAEFCNDAGRIPSLQEFEEYFPHKPMGILRECEVHEDVRTKNTTSHDARVKKLSLGFFVQLTKWANIKILCDAIKKDEFEFFDIAFPNWQMPIYFGFDRYVKNEDGAYKDLQTLQTLRNNFAHFKFNIAKLEETAKLLDDYIAIMEKPANFNACI